MPQLDVSEILSDPDFAEINALVRIRNAQSVGSDGMAVNTPTSTPFTGVVTQATGNQLKRADGGSYIEGSILVHSRLPMTAGMAGIDADQISWVGRVFTVANVADYSRFGAGFTCATCEPFALSGS